MDAGTHAHTDLGKGGPERPRASDRAGGPVEHDEKAVACALDLAPAETVYLLANEFVVTLEHLAPRPVGVQRASTYALRTAERGCSHQRPAS